MSVRQGDECRVSLCLFLLRCRFFRGGEVVFHEDFEFFVFDFVHVCEFVKNPAKLFVCLDGDVAVFAEDFEFQKAAVPSVRKFEIFEQAGLFLANGEFVCKGVNRGINVRVAEVQKSVACVCGILGKLLGGEVFELFLDFGIPNLQKPVCRRSDTAISTFPIRPCRRAFHLS